MDRLTGYLAMYHRRNTTMGASLRNRKKKSTKKLFANMEVTGKKG